MRECAYHTHIYVHENSKLEYRERVRAYKSTYAPQLSDA